MMRLARFALLFLITSISCAGSGTVRAADAEVAAFDSTDRYRSQTVEGWTLRISDRFEDEDPQLLQDVLAELRRQFVAIESAVPARSVGKLRQIEIWVEVNNPKFPCMCYHVSEDWLKANGVNPDKTGHVELANARNFLSWTKHQPWMVLHELAHGYHHRFLDDKYDNDAIAGAHARSTAAGRYGKVDHVAGKQRSHYAATNPMEYFAEGTEAYFGRNDFYPFDRAELREYDPELVRLLEELWGVSEAERSSEQSTNAIPAE